MSIDPSVLMLPNGPYSEPPLPDIPLWDDLQVPIDLSGSEDVLASIADRPGISSEPPETELLLEEVRTLEQELEDHTSPGTIENEQPQVSSVPWPYDIVSYPSGTSHLDPDRRRSQSQPPPARSHEHCISPGYQVFQGGSKPGAPMFRPATPLPPRFHPYANRPRLHQRSYTSHPTAHQPRQSPQSLVGWRGSPNISIVGPHTGIPTGLVPPGERFGASSITDPARSLDELRSRAVVDIEASTYNFHLYHDQSSLALGLHTQLRQMRGLCAEMQQFIETAFSPGGDCGPQYAVRNTVEYKRLNARKANRNVSSLDEQLQQLPIHDADSREVSAPLTGRELQKLSHAAIDNLLDAFEVYYMSDMFLVEKKAIWLRFIGAGKDLMHKVLD